MNVRVRMVFYLRGQQCLGRVQGGGGTWGADHALLLIRWLGWGCVHLVIHHLIIALLTLV